MHARALSAGVLSLSLFLLGCADDRAATSGLGAPSATVTPTASNHGESDATPPPVVDETPDATSGKPSLKAPPLRFLIRTLRGAGLQSVGQAEPPHGSRFRILSGRFAGAEVFVSAGRVGSGLVGERTEVRRSKHNGVMVKVVRDADGRYVTLRCSEVVWLLFDSADSRPVSALTDLAEAIIEAC